jgi:hypothetical protein
MKTPCIHPSVQYCWFYLHHSGANISDGCSLGWQRYLNHVYQCMFYYALKFLFLFFRAEWKPHHNWWKVSYLVPGFQWHFQSMWAIQLHSSQVTRKDYRAIVHLTSPSANQTFFFFKTWIWWQFTAIRNISKNLGTPLYVQSKWYVRVWIKGNNSKSWWSLLNWID